MQSGLYTKPLQYRMLSDDCTELNPLIEKKNNQPPKYLRVTALKGGNDFQK